MHLDQDLARSWSGCLGLPEVEIIHRTFSVFDEDCSHIVGGGKKTSLRPPCRARENTGYPGECEWQSKQTYDDDINVR